MDAAYRVLSLPVRYKLASDQAAIGLDLSDAEADAVVAIKQNCP